MRIAIDIDSTLHHYWDVVSDISRRRFGIELPYEEQMDWGVTRLKPEQFALCVEESHSDATIQRGKPYPGAVEAVRRWHEQGHFIHITSHRETRCQQATVAWLDSIGLPHDEMYCSYDKITRCREIEIDLLIDDSPRNLIQALEHGIHAATLLHPWNRDVCDVEDVIHAETWPELAALLDPIIAAAAPARAVARS